MNIKKQYEAIYALLEENKAKKVSTILPQLAELMTAKVNQQTFKKDEEGNVTHVYCYYHKEWEDVTEIAYGAKKGTATGLNTMCKQGVSMWSKQQRAKKKAESELTDKLISGELTPDEAKVIKEEIDLKAKEVVAYSIS